MLVRLAAVLAPRYSFRWRGWTNSGPDWSNGPFRWTAPEEARADLDAALSSEQWTAAPVRLVLPLLTEALRLRLVNARHRLHWLVKTWGIFLVLLPFLVLADLPDMLRRVGRWARGAGRGRRSSHP
jgi:hypothetical protein